VKAAIDVIDASAIAIALTDAGVPRATDLAALATTSVGITAARTGVDDLAVGASRFGGMPDAPIGFTWPTRDQRALTFLAQIDLAAARAPGLPAAGSLLFFYDAVEQPWGFEPDHAGGAHVCFVPPGIALRRLAHPPVDPAGGPYAACSLGFTRGFDLPGLYDSLVADGGFGFDDDAEDAYAALLDARAGEAPRHHLLGHPDIVQNDMRVECELVTHGVDAQDESDRAESLRRGAAARWQLLLQIDTDARPGWMWGDCGRLYFWITRADLEARIFDRVWVVLQCS
jgi:uncharacterized protein YwqG